MTEADLFNALDFRWDRQVIPGKVPVFPIQQVVSRTFRHVTEYVWDAGVLEGNPYTFVQVQTLLDGVTVGGHKLSDQEQILNLAESFKRLIKMVQDNQFAINLSVFCQLHAVVARNEALEWGHFRGQGQETHYTPKVALGELGHYTPAPTQPGGKNLLHIFNAGINAIENHIALPLEKALAFFLFGALQQFFFDGNKRTSRLMMNGILITNGINAISIPAAKAELFNEKMVRFYASKEATEMMTFLINCHFIHL